MELTPSNLRTLRTSLRKDFQKGYTETEVFWRMLATMVPSTTKKNTYGWMAALPSMREWLGERVVHNLAAHSYEVANRRFELTLGVDRDDIEDDNLGVYSMVFEQAGNSTAKHPDQLVVELLKTAQALVCFDGQNYFDTDHPVNGVDTSAGVYSNYRTSFALTQANFLTLRAAILSQLNEAGRNLQVSPGTMLIPPALEGAAIDIVAKEKTTGGMDNTTYKMADYKVIPELAGEDTTWYLGDFSKPIKPIVYQLRRALATVMKGNPEDLEVLQQNQQVFYADQRDAVGCTLPFLLHKAVA